MPLIGQGAQGNTPIPITGSATLVSNNNAADQRRLAEYKITGSIASVATITMPGVGRIGWIWNETNQGIVLTTGAIGGTSLTVDAGYAAFFDNDGTNVVNPPQQIGTLDVSVIQSGSEGIASIMVGTLDVTGTATVANLVLEGGLPPGVNYGDVKDSGIAVEAGGWRLCYGQARPRTDPLWVYIVANSISWPWGNGDGSTTYTMPDFRGRSRSGQDNMGGTPANRITGIVSGITATALGATGGDQQSQGHTHTDSGHGHLDAGHLHSDSGHAHSDAGHTHTDAGHTHPPSSGGNFATILDNNGNIGYPTPRVQASGTTTGYGNANIESGYASIQTGYATIQPGYASIETGYASIQTYGSGASQNMPPTAIVSTLMYVGA